MGSLGYFPAMDVVRQALPMILAFLKMALVICIPLTFLVVTVDLKTLMTITCAQFALFFVDFWFPLARWIDSTILDALYGWDSPHCNFNLLMGLNNSFGDMLLNFVMGSMFIVFPGFRVSALTWVGFRMGGALQGLSDGSRAAAVVIALRRSILRSTSSTCWRDTSTIGRSPSQGRMSLMKWRSICTNVLCHPRLRLSALKAFQSMKTERKQFSEAAQAARRLSRRSARGSTPWATKARA